MSVITSKLVDLVIVIGSFLGVAAYSDVPGSGSRTRVPMEPVPVPMEPVGTGTRKFLMNGTGTQNFWMAGILGKILPCGAIFGQNFP